MPIESSRSRFAQYRRHLVERKVGRHGEEQPKPDAPLHRSFGQLLWQFFGLLEGQRWAVGFGLATLTVATLLNLLPPLATKVVFDNVLGESELPPIWTRYLPLPADRMQLLFWIVGAVAAVSFTASAVHLWGRWYATKAVNRMQVAIRKRVFEHAVRLPLDRVIQIKSGGAASFLREDAGGVGNLIFSMIYNPWRAVIQLVGSLIVLVVVDWRLMLGGLALLPAVYLTHRTWINRIRPLYRDVRRERQKIDGQVTEAFGGMRVVRTFGRDKSEASRYVRNNDFMVRQSLLAWWWSRIIEIIWEVFIPLASTALLLYGGYQVLTGGLSIGDLAMFLVYLLMLLGPIATLATSATTFQNSLAGLDRILDLLEEPQEIPDSPDLKTLDRSRVAGRITLSGVGFRYPGSKPLVLEDIDLDIEPGETVALVGRSGAGKTTLTNLVARFYEPTVGGVLLDGIDLREIHVDSYRKLLGIVEQDVFLFDGTIGENISYSRRHAALEQIEDAARAANIHEFIVSLEAGYDTLIGERGVKLSGGQRQRLAIARAILADPRILILDEATSNLDSESELLIRQSLEELMVGRTSLIIAHRLSTISHADRIVVLEDGRIAEIGTHDDLMSHTSRYRQMVEAQLGIQPSF